jgi:hypothetical protein
MHEGIIKMKIHRKKRKREKGSFYSNAMAYGAQPVLYPDPIAGGMNKMNAKPTV